MEASPLHSRENYAVLSWLNNHQIRYALVDLRLGSFMRYKRKKDVENSVVNWGNMLSVFIISHLASGASFWFLLLFWSLFFPLVSRSVVSGSWMKIVKKRADEDSLKHFYEIYIWFSLPQIPEENYEEFFFPFRRKEEFKRAKKKKHNDFAMRKKEGKGQTRRSSMKRNSWRRKSWRW